MSITAGQVAIELRKLADSLDREPEAAIEKPGVYLYHWGQKETFLALAKILPRPLTKKYTETDVFLEYRNDAIDVSAQISRNKVCELVEPAKPAVYRCEPLLSEAEEAAVEQV